MKLQLDEGIPKLFLKVSGFGKYIFSTEGLFLCSEITKLAGNYKVDGKISGVSAVKFHFKADTAGAETLIF